MLPTRCSGRTRMESRGDGCKRDEEIRMGRTQGEVEGGGTVDGGEVSGEEGMCRMAGI